MADLTDMGQDAAPAVGHGDAAPAVVVPHHPSDPASAGPPPAPRFSPFLTGLSVLILLGSVFLFAWLQATVPRLSRVDEPERALALMVGRSMDLEEVFADAPPWERLLFDLTMSDSGETLPLASVWYEELADSFPDPQVRLQSAILEGEAGKLDRVRAAIQAWAKGKDPFPLFARWLSAAYLEPGIARAEELALQAELAERIPAGWFYDRLAIQIATKAGDQPLLSATKKAQISRTEPLMQRARILAGLQLFCMVAGLIALALVVRSRGERRVLQVGAAPVPPLWRGRLGSVVLIRGGAISALLTLALLSLETDSLLVRAVAIPLTNLPILLLAQRHLFGPTGVGWLQGLGLRPLPAAWGRLGLMLAALLAAALLGEWGLGRVAEAWDLSSHWTEWFDGDLVWGSGLLLAVSLVEYVVFAPLFEELVFRGLLFATLRRKYGWAAAGAISAGIFALAHGYGILGTVSVFWSGMLWAWAYEKTGSLLPGMAAHMLNNLLVCATVMALLR
ncbi:MAG: CPBP family intramembrane metalloprotease [Nitrospirae bacterium]|nr:MAG: CPBP family intramembrane metalloprotease [Nitrospirota bacterium]